MGLSQRRVRLVKRLRTHKTRAREGAVLVEGVRAVSEALDAGVEVSFVVTSPRLKMSAGGARLAERLATYGPVVVEDGELERLSDTEQPQGVLLVCREPEARPDRIFAGRRYLVLDRVQDPGNVGTLIRSAVAFGIEAALCLDGTADPWSAKAVRASAGMVFRIPVVKAVISEVTGRLADLDVPLYVADVRGVGVSDAATEGSFALVVGNEAGGVRRQLVNRARQSLAVRMPGPAESLNVAVAGSILLYALTGGELK